jgi:hypothetical protein
VIRLDHQVAVLDRFYEGPRVRALASSFRAWQADLNLETAGLFRELVVACGEAPGAGDPALRRTLADLRRREATARAARLGAVCDYRRALERYAEVSVALGKRHAAAGASRRPRGPRHVAAVAAAIGVLGCAVAHDPGVAEAAPPPLDRPVSGPPPPPLREPSVECVVTPFPSPAPPGPEVVEPPFRHDEGVAEAAPPPYRHDLGVAEAAPPPYERPRPPPIPSFVVRTVPAVPLRFGGARVAEPFAFPADSGEPLLVGGGGKLRPIARITVSAEDAVATRVVIESEEPFTVRCGGTSSPSPAQVVLRGPERGGTFVLEHARSGARVEVHVARRR